MKPFNREFNAAVFAMASRVCPTGYDIAENEPSNLPDLIDQIERTGRIVVSSLNCDATIFGGSDEREFNYAFRAWHDWTHYHIRAEFTLAGEARVAVQQVADLAKGYGPAFAERYKPLLFAEIIGQALYKEITGEFPRFQRTFDSEFLACIGSGWADPREISADYHATQDHVKRDYR